MKRWLNRPAIFPPVLGTKLNNMPGIFNIRPSGEIRREIKTRITIDMSNNEKMTESGAIEFTKKKLKEKYDQSNKVK